MPAAKKPASRTTTTHRRKAAAEPAALKRLNKSLDQAQEALAALRNDVGKDVSEGARDLYKDVGKFVRDARRHSGKLGTALRKDLEELHQRLEKSGGTGAGPRRAAGRSTSRKPTGGARSASTRARSAKR